MKYIYALLCCCLLSCATETQRIDICFPDKGIKTSKIYKDYDTDYSIMITYNREGYPMKEEYTRLKQLYEYRYSNDTLLYTITTKLDRGDYPEGDPESDYVDTLFVRNFEKDPRRY
ncbi:MAG: hypothetical protein AB8B65_20925, partial [Kordia sp.]|uniref:hypothetical protein n=1 Tax=Kordia sp. TaxID=1965332 RepID=UPI00385AFC49